MTVIRRFRYYVGARLLWPHVQQQMRRYEGAGDVADGTRRNCQYIHIGLQYSIDKHRRRESAERNHQQ